MCAARLRHTQTYATRCPANRRKLHVPLLHLCVREQRVPGRRAAACTCSKMLRGAVFLLLLACLASGMDVDIVVPEYQVKGQDAYVCTTIELPEKPMKLVGVEPIAKQEVVHHILLFGELLLLSQGSPGQEQRLQQTCCGHGGSPQALSQEHGSVCLGLHAVRPCSSSVHHHLGSQHQLLNIQNRHVMHSVLLLLGGHQVVNNLSRCQQKASSRPGSAGPPAQGVRSTSCEWGRPRWED